MVQPIPQQSWVIDGTMILEEYLGATDGAARSPRLPPLFNFRPTDRSLKPTVLTGLHARSLAQKNSLVFSARSLAARRPVRPTRDASEGRGGAEGDRRRDAPLAVPSATVARGSLPRQTDGRRKRRRSLGLQCSQRNQRTKCVCREGKGVSENDGPSECTRRE